jgi:hypothetical protein
MRGAGWPARASCPALAQVCGCHRRDVQAPQYAETPRPSRPYRAPTLAAQLETGSRRDAPLRVLEVMGPLPVHASADSPKPRAPGRCVRSRNRGAASRRSSVSSRRLWGAQFGGRRQAGRPGRPGYRNRGEGVASPVRLLQSKRSSALSPTTIESSRAREVRWRRCLCPEGVALRPFWDVARRVGAVIGRVLLAPG